MADKGNLYDFYAVSWSARVRVGTKIFPVVSFEASYRLNEIPFVSLIVPVGRDQKTGMTISAKEILDETGVSGDAVPNLIVYMTASSYPEGRDAPKSDGLSKAEIEVFRGYVLSPSLVRSANSAGIRIIGFGELGGLASGTSMIDTLQSSVGDDGIYRKTTELQNVKGKAASVEVLMGRGLSRNLGAALHLMLTQMASGAFQTKEGRKSERATNALKTVDYAYGSLAMRVFSGEAGARISGAYLDRALALAVSGVVFGAWAADSAFQERDADLWTILKELARVFAFTIVPTVGRTYLAPVIPGQSGKGHEIDPDEYFHLTTGPYDPRGYGYVTGVVLFAHGAQISNWQSGGARTAIVGEAVLSSNPDAGRLKLVGAPRWLLSPGAAFNLDMSDFYDGTIVAKGKPPAAPQGEIELNYARTGVGDAYAKTVLYSELFGNRTLTLRGRVRTDIAPGNQVDIRTVGEAFGDADSSGGFLYGLVNAVTIRLGEGQSCTELSVTHVRTEKERAEYAVDLHPIYLIKWPGVRLA